MYEIEHYITDDGKDVYQTRYERLRDARARLAIAQRLVRVEQGNFGDHRYCQDGVWELRLDVGAGYRVYYSIQGRKVVLLLCGGDKGSQSADIGRAINYVKLAARERQ